MARKDRPRIGRALGRILKAAGAIIGCSLPGSLAFGRSSKPASLRVCVYYDAGNGSSPSNGKLHAIMLENLLGHFREAAVLLRAADQYKKSDVDVCDRAVYIGSNYDSRLPPDFLQDISKYSRPFLWINYNIQKLQEAMGKDAFASKCGFRFQGLRGFDVSTGTGLVPDFYSRFEYKGELFNKLAYVRKEDGALVSSPEIALLGDVTAKVISIAAHPPGGASTPYITEKEGFFFIADNPFVYIGEDDRYLIVADLLFDFLKLPPRSVRRYALLRLEDVHPNYDLKLLYRAIEALKERKVPFAISLIPKFVNAGKDESSGIGINDRPEFLRALRYARINGGVILLHGYTHNVSGRAGCLGIASGADYEFWDRCAGSPLPYDSEEFARARIDKAKALLSGAGLSVAGWVTPHYTASPVDFEVFAKAFDRTVQRVRYSVGNPEGSRNEVYVSQFFPYTIYKDHYGQFVWPENLGYMPMPGSGPGERGLGDILGSARRTRAVRDGWASFFWHPQLGNTPNGIETLVSLIDGIRASGYDFVSLEEMRARNE